jgi:hypothetical protein
MTVGQEIGAACTLCRNGEFGRFVKGGKAGMTIAILRGRSGPLKLANRRTPPRQIGPR